MGQKFDQNRHNYSWTEGVAFTDMTNLQNLVHIHNNNKILFVHVSQCFVCSLNLCVYIIVAHTIASGHAKSISNVISNQTPDLIFLQRGFAVTSHLQQTRQHHNDFAC